MRDKSSIKDYYTTLRLSKSATPKDIKKAHRHLVQQFHPDKNRGNEYASAYFLEIQEAYEVLSDPNARKVYDRELANAGLAAHKKPTVTPRALLHQAQQLRTDVNRMNVYRIDTPWLKASLISILSDQHVAILSKAGLSPLRTAFITELLPAIRLLHYPYPEKITLKIEALATMDEKTQNKWNTFLKKERKQYLWRKTIPWLGIILTILICVMMYFYVHK